MYSRVMDGARAELGSHSMRDALPETVSLSSIPCVGKIRSGHMTGCVVPSVSGKSSVPALGAGVLSCTWNWIGTEASVCAG